MTAIPDLARIQQALDALIVDDRSAVDAAFSEGLVLTGPGGCVKGRYEGLQAVLDRFAVIATRTSGTFGTEVEAVYEGSGGQLVTMTRHWASLDGATLHGTQALLLQLDGDRICRIDMFRGPGAATGIWD